MDDLSLEAGKSFQEKLALARAGSHEAFDQIILPFRVALRRMARERIERRLQAKISDSDLIQITNLQAFENLNQFRGNTLEEFGCWLLGIMNHTAASQHRRYHRPGRDISREVPLERVWEVLTTSLRESDNDEKCRRVKAALNKLPDVYRKVLVWHYYEKKSYQEIGNRVGVSADTAKHACYRAVGKLGNELRKQEAG
jgi:RNA polymerase sigma-70 factor (ECF subfamily)